MEGFLGNDYFLSFLIIVFIIPILYMPIILFFGKQKRKRDKATLAEIDHTNPDELHKRVMESNEPNYNEFIIESLTSSRIKYDIAINHPNFLTRDAAVYYMDDNDLLLDFIQQEKDVNLQATAINRLTSLEHLTTLKLYVTTDLKFDIDDRIRLLKAKKEEKAITPQARLLEDAEE